VSAARQINRLYARQEKKFYAWTNDLLTCAYLLWKTQCELGEEHFSAWLKKHCPKVDPEMAANMIDQLLNTTPGKQLIQTLDRPGQNA